jgi:hypothetical protein
MMQGRGKHVSSGSSAFIRDLVVMAVGIVIVGVLLYGGLSLVAGFGSNGGDDTTTTGEPPTGTTATSQPATTVTSTAATTTTVAETTTTTITLREPGEVTVVVLNSTGRSGIAGALTQSLADRGYVTLQADNYPEVLDVSRVWYTGDFAPEAAELADAVPDALIEPYEGPDVGADIVVVLGASYQG